MITKIKSPVAKFLLSLLLLFVSISFFYFPYTKVVRKINKKEGLETTRTYYSSIEYGSQTIGTFLLLLMVWIWRHDLDIDSLGIFSKKTNPFEEIEPTDELEINTADQSGPIEDLSKVKISKTSIIKDKLIEYIKKNGYVVSTYHLCYKLGINRNDAEELLFELASEGKIDINYAGKKTIFIDLDSIESLAINWYQNKIKKNQSIISISKFLTVRKMLEFDGLIETESHYHFIDVVDTPKSDNQSINLAKRKYKKLAYLSTNYNKPSNLILILIKPNLDACKTLSSTNKHFTIIDLPKSKLKAAQKRNT